MHTETIVVVGAGGHGKVVCDSLLYKIDKKYIKVVDSNPKLENTELFKGLIIKALDRAMLLKNVFHVAVGNNLIRKQLFDLCLKEVATPYSIAHPSAQVSEITKLAGGSFFAALSVVSSSVEIGSGAIINHGAIIDHDCKLGNFVHIAPNATLGGGVIVGDTTLIGAGANVLPNVNIGKNVVIGAGSVVINDIPDNSKYVGVPAQKIG